MKRKIFKEDIIKAGLDLMFLDGYNATGIKKITDEVDIPKGSFYNHFLNKEEFGIEVLEYYCSRGLKFHEDNLLDQTEKSPLKRLEKFYTKMIDNYADVLECKLGCVMSNFSLELGDTNENFREVLDREFNAIEAVIVACLDEARIQGELKSDFDSKLLGSFILNSWHGALVRMKSTGTIEPLEDFRTMIFRQILI